MTETEVIEKVSSMSRYEKTLYYLDYYIGMLWLNAMFPNRPSRIMTSDEFFSHDRISKRVAPEDWEEKGWAQKEWVVLECPSIWYYVQKDILSEQFRKTKSPT